MLRESSKSSDSFPVRAVSLDSIGRRSPGVGSVEVCLVCQSSPGSRVFRPWGESRFRTSPDGAARTRRGRGGGPGEGEFPGRKTVHPRGDMRLRHPWLICRPLDPRLVADRWGRFIVAGLMIVSCARQDPMAAAQELLRKGETREAVELLRGAVEEDPADPRREHWYGYALIQNKQLALATWPLRRAMRDPAFTVKSGVLLARTFLKTDNAPDAERIATAVLEVEPEHRAARRIRARARINMSKEEAALEDLEVLLDEDPSQLSIHEMVLDSLIRLERIEEAQARLDLMAELVDEKGIGDPGARAHLCVRGANLKRHRQALEAANEAFEECLAAFPGNTEVVNQAVDFHRARGDRKRELETLRKAVEANPDDLQRLMQLSLELRADGRGEEAEGRLLEVAERLD
ncbi:MAG TPA: tetratricopeptide repeat protein, partial [Deltaproteobacteria bacterium]|nr:tetratricopeptide repeat protein [Deltaproteobacteria bacterium]